MVAVPCATARLDHVGVERALDEVLGVVEARGLLLEDADELLADDLPLRLGVRDPGEPVQEALLRVDGDERHLELVPEGGHHLVALVLAHEAVVHEHAGELVPDRPVGEQRGHRRVHPAGQAADHLAVPHLLADPRDLLLHHRRGAPRHVAAGDVTQEGLEDLGAVGGVRHLGMELDPVEATGRVLHRRHRGLRRGRQRGEARRGLEDGVAVAHPAALLLRDSGEELSGVVHREGVSGRTRPPRRPPPSRPGRAPSPAFRNRCRAPGCRARAAPGAGRGRRRHTPRRARRTGSAPSARGG